MRERNDIIDINLRNGAFSTGDGSSFGGQIVLGLSRRESRSYDSRGLEGTLNRVGTTFSRAALEERRSGYSKLGFEDTP